MVWVCLPVSDHVTLVLGGTRSGKSRYAVEMARESGVPVLFVATAEALDEEMRDRIQQHRLSRPAEWCTLEAATNIGARIAEEIRGERVVVIDCLSLLVSNLLGSACSPSAADDIDVRKAEKKVAEEMRLLVASMDKLSVSFIVVSNEVGMGLVPNSRLGRVYRDLLGWANQRVAERSVEVVLMVAGLPWRLKG